MRPTFTLDATHKFVAPENWDPEKFGECGDLHVRVAPAPDNGIIESTSTWKPDAEDIVRINAGGVIEIALCIPNQCVMRAYVVDPFMPPALEPAPITINEHAHGDDHHAPLVVDNDLAPCDENDDGIELDQYILDDKHGAD